VRAAWHTRYGPPDVVSVRDIATPAPAAGEIRVRVVATTVNRTDCHYRSATPWPMRLFTGLRRPRVHVWGTEYAGTVDALGAGVSGYELGSPVMGYLEGRFGAHAEHLVARADGPISALGRDVDLAVAAAGTEGSHYALASLARAGAAVGRSVLIYGATGAIGSAAVQLAALDGDEVTAVCAGAHLDLVASLGARHVRNYEHDDLGDLDGRFDVVFDAVGKFEFARARRLLRPGGVYASSGVGPFGQNLLLAAVGPIMRGRRVLFAFPHIDQSVVQHLARLIESREFVPLVDRRYPLTDIVAAYRYVETGQKLGNVVIDVAPADSRA
jgi:NADPH:quinone reductase-like Zn-dependent oxidoreductase